MEQSSINLNSSRGFDRLELPDSKFMSEVNLNISISDNKSQMAVSSQYTKFRDGPSGAHH